MSKSRRRGFSSWLVEPYKQVRLGLMFLLVNLGFAGLFVAVFGYYVWDIYQAMVTYFALNAGQSAVTLTKFSFPVLIVLALIGLFVMTTLFVSVRYTHEIYGPLVSIHRFLDEMLRGMRPAPIRLRESDQLKDVATKLNNVAERLSINEKSESLKVLHGYLDELLAGRRPDQPTALVGDEQLAVISEKIDALTKQLDRQQPTGPTSGSPSSP